MQARVCDHCDTIIETEFGTFRLGVGDERPYLDICGYDCLREWANSKQREAEVQ